MWDLFTYNVTYAALYVNKSDTSSLAEVSQRAWLHTCDVT